MMCARRVSSRSCSGGAGDSLDEARVRLAALAPDASAQRAARDTVHTLLAAVEKLIPRPARQEFSLLVWAGWLEAKLVELPPQQAANAVTRRRFAEQWSESNPRFRAAHAVASYLEREGVAPLSAGGTVYSDEREILDAERDYWQPRVAVHFGAKLLHGRCSISAREHRAFSSSSTRPHASRRFAPSTCGRRSTARSSSSSSTATAG
jgi:hypothetical protein